MKLNEMNSVPFSFENGDVYREALLWAEQNATGKVCSYLGTRLSIMRNLRVDGARSHILLFEHESDAASFRLRWG